MIASPVGNQRSWDGLGPLGVLSRFPGWSRPTVLALLLATLSLPIVALTVGAVDEGAGLVPRVPASDLQQWLAAASAVFISAMVAGMIGGPLVRRNSGGGAVLTFVIALAVAVPALPLLSALLGQYVGAGYGCVDVCSDATSSSNLILGFQSDLFLYFAPLAEPIPVLILALGVALWTIVVRRLPES
jgi:hypothetical protein